MASRQSIAAAQHVGRVVWPSLVEQIRTSYDLAKYDRAGSAKMGRESAAGMRHWAGSEAVWRRLRSALDALVQGRLDRTDVEDEQPAPVPLRTAA